MSMCESQHTELGGAGERLIRHSKTVEMAAIPNSQNRESSQCDLVQENLHAQNETDAYLSLP